MTLLRIERPTLTADQQAYVDDIAQRSYMNKTELAACTCLWGGPAHPTPEQKATIQASHNNCPVHGKSTELWS